MLIGLTGSFGSGKSTVSSCFQQLGATIIDSDATVAEIYANDSDFLQKLRNRFGESVFDSEGTVDRKALGSRVFSNADELLWLETNLHPLVHSYRMQKIAKDPNALWIAEIPLLFEKNLEKDMDRSISVISCYSLRVARLKKRGFSPEEVEKRNSLQLPQIVKISRADFVILNDGSFEFLKRQVKLLFHQLNS
jgi:dephospho-CoA kinase